METYSKENDYELVALAKEGNEDAINMLYEKYKPIIVKKSETMIVKTKYLGVEINDIMQECYIAFDEAINNFNECNDVSFYTFAMLCIDRRMINFSRYYKTNKNKVFNESIHINEYIINTIKSDFDTENEVLYSDSKKNIINYLYNNLTEFEKEVLKYKINGYNNEDIANTLNRDIKSIYNTIQRIKHKLKDLM